MHHWREPLLTWACIDMNLYCRLQKLLRHQNLKGNLNHEHSELEDQFDILMDANDQILERAVISHIFSHAWLYTAKLSLHARHFHMWSDLKFRIFTSRYILFKTLTVADLNTLVVWKSWTGMDQTSWQLVVDLAVWLLSVTVLEFLLQQQIAVRVSLTTINCS